MKHLTLIAILASLFSVSAFAEGQTNTECPWMREMSKRSNPKAGMDFQSKAKASVKSATSTKQ